jgi:formiminotetrahydrofolate cyclodeaminase
MNYAEGPIRKYLDDAAAKLPAPGGGSIAAAIGALGASMASMVANFTIGRKKYADVEDEMRIILELVETEREQLIGLIDADVAAYGEVSAAYGMPKGSDEEKAARSSAIKEACRTAMGAPMDAARCCARIAAACERLVDIGNKNLITDVGVSALAADAGCKSAALNVEINLGAIGDDAFAAETRQELDEMLGETAKITKSVMKKVKNAI